MHDRTVSYSILTSAADRSGFAWTIYFDGLLGAAIETAHSASVNAARVERQIAQLYGLIAEAEESSLGLTLPIEVADPQLNQLESGRFAGVVDQQGQVIWASASTALLSEKWIVATRESIPAFGVPQAGRSTTESEH